MASTKPDCIFCKIIRRESPASIVDEDDRTITFLDIQPINPGHTLVIPKVHADATADLDPDVGGRMFQRGMAIAAALRRSGVRCEGVNFLLADGKAAGQDIFHVHLHLIPRFRGDTGLRLRPEDGRGPDRKELDRIAEAIRHSMEGR